MLLAKLEPEFLIEVPRLIETRKSPEIDSVKPGPSAKLDGFFK
jgi:hypothetical protein